MAGSPVHLCCMNNVITYTHTVTKHHKVATREAQGNRSSADYANFKLGLTGVSFSFSLHQACAFQFAPAYSKNGALMSCTYSPLDGRSSTV